jgi:hypothetical protein
MLGFVYLTFLEKKKLQMELPLHNVICDVLVYIF